MVTKITDCSYERSIVSDLRHGEGNRVQKAEEGSLLTRTISSDENDSLIESSKVSFLVQAKYFGLRSLSGIYEAPLVVNTFLIATNSLEERVNKIFLANQITSEIFTKCFEEDIFSKFFRNLGSFREDNIIQNLSRFCLAPTFSSDIGIAAHALFYKTALKKQYRDISEYLKVAVYDNMSFYPVQEGAISEKLVLNSTEKYLQETCPEDFQFTKYLCFEKPGKSNIKIFPSETIFFGEKVEYTLKAVICSLKNGCQSFIFEKDEIFIYDQKTNSFEKADDELFYHLTSVTKEFENKEKHPFNLEKLEESDLTDLTFLQERMEPYDMFLINVMTRAHLFIYEKVIIKNSSRET